VDEAKPVLDFVSAALRKRMKNQWTVSRMQQARPVCGVPNCSGCRVLNELFAEPPLFPPESRQSESERGDI